MKTNGIAAFFLQQGFVIGDIVGLDDSSFIVKNPALVITRSNGLVLAPFLQLVEEDTVKIQFKDITFGQLFTPHVELSNEYNKIFGSGIIVSNTLPL